VGLDSSYEIGDGNNDHCDHGKLQDQHCLGFGQARREVCHGAPLSVDLVLFSQGNPFGGQL
jgi:hypothetical protein